MSATVPDCMCASPCRFRPTPLTTPRPSSISKTRALANSVPTSSAVHAVRPPLPCSRVQSRRRTVISSGPARIAQLALERADPVGQHLGGDRSGGLDRSIQEVLTGTEVRIGSGAGERLDPAYARADAPLAGDHETPDLAGGAAVRAAT